MTTLFADACSLAALNELRLLPLEVLVMDKFLLEDGLKLLPYLCPADENDAVDGLLSQESCDGGRSFTLGSVNDDFVLLFYWIRFLSTLHSPSNCSKKSRCDRFYSPCYERRARLRVSRQGCHLSVASGISTRAGNC